MLKKSKILRTCFRAKKDRRKRLTSLPAEDKFDLLLQLQRIAGPILKSRGKKREPWIDNIHLFQVRGDIESSRPSGSIDLEVGGKKYISIMNYKPYPHVSIIANSNTPDVTVSIDKWEGLQ